VSVAFFGRRPSFDRAGEDLRAETHQSWADLRTSRSGNNADNSARNINHRTWVFGDGFESGDSSAWPLIVP